MLEMPDNEINLASCPQFAEKQSCRSEIWNWFAYRHNRKTVNLKNGHLFFLVILSMALHQSIILEIVMKRSVKYI